MIINAHSLAHWAFKQFLAAGLLTTLTAPAPPKVEALPQDPPQVSQAEGFLQVEQADPKHPQIFPAERAMKIYWRVCQGVARDVRPEHPERILPAPRVVLKLGAQRRSLTFSTTHVGPKEVWLMTVEMPHFKVGDVTQDEDAWKDENFFARAMAVAAGTQVLQVEELLGIGDLAQRQVDSEVGVKEMLKEGK